MILLYLEGSGSKFHSVNTKTSQFSPFLDSRSWEKTCIYICIYVNYFQPFPHILWVAQLPMGFHLAPTPVDARNAMSSHQTFVLCSISAPDFCKTRDMYIYICMSIQTLFKEDIVFRGTFKFPDLYSGICQWFQVSISKCTLHIHIYILIYNIFQAVPQNYNGIQPLIGFHVKKHIWQTSTFMWQTMANSRINLSFGDALYSDMYHPFMMILGRIFRSIHQTTHHITQPVLRVLFG